MCAGECVAKSASFSLKDPYTHDDDDYNFFFFFFNPKHSQHCGAATGIFLLINASVIIIIRGHRFCLWGSVYLDTHGEEDRDLR